MPYVIANRRFEDHTTSPGHPEGADRAQVVRERIDDMDSSSYTSLETSMATREQLLAVHDEQYVAEVRRASEAETSLDTDTPVSRESYDVARLAAGSSITLARRCIEDDCGGFSVVRPPGHHAEPDRGMGFCLFNNVAVAVEAVLEQLQRVAIVDVDVHHGNGTQSVFYDRSDVMYISIHQSPLYPGTGSADETGTGEGDGYTLNNPVSASSDWETIEPFVRDTVVDRLTSFDPGLLMISAGFDAHQADPVGGLALSDDGYNELYTILTDVAEQVSKGRIVALLEGGYDRDVLARNVPRVIELLS